MEQRNRHRAVIGIALILLVAAAGSALAQDTAPAAKRSEEMAKAAEASVKAREEPEGFWEMLWARWEELHKLGGRTMVFLAVAYIIGFLSVLERLISLIFAASSVSGRLGEARALWEQGRFDELLKLAESRSGITNRLIAFAVRHRGRKADDVSASMSGMASRWVKWHQRLNYPLVVVATISPLLGLLGTIIGMIEAFDKVNIAGSMGSAEYLSGAISKALITTEGGLIIAIPALFFYHVYKFLTGVLADSLEGKANAVVMGCLVPSAAAQGQVVAAGGLSDQGVQREAGQ